MWRLGFQLGGNFFGGGKGVKGWRLQRSFGGGLGSFQGGLGNDSECCQAANEERQPVVMPLADPGSGRCQLLLFLHCTVV